jgi:hypothetical protein
MHQLPGLLELLNTYFPQHAHITDVEGQTSKCHALQVMSLCVFCTLIYAAELVSKVTSLLEMSYFSNHSTVSFSHDENDGGWVCGSCGSVTEK